MRRTALIIILLIAGLFVQVSSAFATQPTSIKVAIDKNYPPVSVIGPDGKAHGLFINIWELWSQETGVAVEFIPSDWAGTLEALHTGEVDAHSGLFQNDERAQWMDFSSPFHKIKTAVYFRSNVKNIRPLSDMTGKRVGVVKGFFQETFLRETYPDLVLMPYQDGEQLFVGLLKGEIDALSMKFLV